MSKLQGADLSPQIEGRTYLQIMQAYSGTKIDGGI
jgi:hypothetical protein